MNVELGRPDDGGRFISLWELLVQIGEAEAIYPYEAARDLASCLDDDPEGIKHIRHRDELGILCLVETDTRLRLLRLLSFFGAHATLFDDDGRPNDAAQPTFERFGFYASDIYPFLSRHNVAISRPGGDAFESRVFGDGRRIPGWILTYDGQNWIPYRRVVGILTACTVAAERHSTEHDDVSARWSTALSDAIQRGAISVTAVSGNQMLAHADVLSWCTRHGYMWPLEVPLDESDIASDVLRPLDHKVSSRPNVDESQITKRERQIRVLEEMADKLGYLRLQIPDGGQTEIHKLCHAKDPHLFTENYETFRGIWKDAVKAGRIRMKNHNKFAGG